MCFWLFLQILYTGHLEKLFGTVDWYNSGWSQSWRFFFPGVLCIWSHVNGRNFPKTELNSQVMQFCRDSQLWRILIDLWEKSWKKWMQVSRLLMQICSALSCFKAEAVHSRDEVSTMVMLLCCTFHSGVWWTWSMDLIEARWHWQHHKYLAPWWLPAEVVCFHRLFTPFSAHVGRPRQRTCNVMVRILKHLL